MIVLTSSVASVADHIFSKYLKEKNFKSVLFIDTAAELQLADNTEDNTWFFNDLKSLERQGYQVDRFSVTDKTRQEITAKIDEYDVIYVSGGNTVYLLQQLQISDSVSVIRDAVRAGKTYIGTSAGSIIAGPKVPIYLEDSNDIRLEDYTGFGFTTMIPVPHWGSPHFKEIYLEGRIQNAYKEDEPPFLLLNDHQYMVINEDGLSQVIHVT